MPKIPPQQRVERASQTDTVVATVFHLTDSNDTSLKHEHIPPTLAWDIVFVSLELIHILVIQ